MTQLLQVARVVVVGDVCIDGLQVRVIDEALNGGNLRQAVRYDFLLGHSRQVGKQSYIIIDHISVVIDSCPR